MALLKWKEQGGSLSEQIYNYQNELAKLIERHTGRDGAHETAIPSLSFSRISNAGGFYMEGKGQFDV
ncbi:hypothetical protein [Heyndrickxia ginsengihumi]|uniref:hypothetical protein n=1 Tax=Heyndrickxia ginsengihumi TaxID=363870 RepID=UPI0027B88290|nr:hypothetical protein [Heyndrickxia ginsengihumi]